LVISGHVTKMSLTPFDPSLPKTHATRKPRGSMFYRLPRVILWWSGAGGIQALSARPRAGL